jgi:exodeoxyribonuclease I
MSYIFYDTETSGLSPEFDQILQFAAIRTDNDLNEVDRFEIRSQLLPYIVPSPRALQVTGIGPDTLIDRSLPSHYEMVSRIQEQLLAWSPAVLLGYNTLSFDENFLRQCLYQTLRSPYLTNTSRNVRADVLRLVQAAAAYAPDCLTIPVNDKGGLVFRLDQLAPKNGFSHDNAHEAMADVEATIHIAKVIKDGAPEVWQRVMSACRKSTAIETVMSTDVLAMTETYFNKAYSWLVTYCGQNPNYDAQVAVFDLHYDPRDYLDLDVGALVEMMNGKHKVIRSVRTNAQPILMPFELATAENVVKIPDPDTVSQRVDAIKSDASFRDRVGQALAKRFSDDEPSPFPEKRIYDGFPSRFDEILMLKFHQREWPERLALVEMLEDDKRREFAFRLIFSDASATLSAQKKDELETWVRGRILSNDESVPWYTIPKAIRETDELMAESSDSDKVFLSKLRAFYEDTPNRLSAW